MREYRISEDSFTRANLQASARLRRMLLGGCSLLILLLAAFQYQRPGALPTYGGALAFIWLFFLFVAPALNRWQFGRIYRANALLQQVQRVDMQGGLIRLGSAHAESSYRLEELKKIRLLPDMVLLYPSATYFHMVPRSVFSDDEVARLRQHADGH